MSHFATLVLIDKNIVDVELKVSELLSQYSENVEVEPHKEYMEGESLALMEDHYGTKDLKSHIKDWTGKSGGVDERGLYSWSTYNPISRWDWYVIGGRWDGLLWSEEVANETHGGFNFDDSNHTLELNCRSVLDLPPDLKVFAIVTPDGKWNEKGKMGWWGYVSKEQPDEA